MFNFNEVKTPSFSFTDCAFGVVSKKSLSNLSSIYYSVFISNNFLIVFYFRYYSFWVNSYKGWKFCVVIHIFARECPVVQAPFVEKTICFLLHRLCSFVTDQLTILFFKLIYLFLFSYLWVSFRSLHSLLLIHVAIILPMPHCLDYFSFTVGLKVWCCQASNVVVSNTAIPIVCFAPLSFRNQLVYMHKHFAEIFIGIPLNL